MKARKLTQLSLLTAAALIMFTIEAQLPALAPIPGMKLGLSNVITLLALCLFGWCESAAILLVRIVLGSVFAGQVTSLFYSLAGGVTAFLVMMITLKLLGKDRLPFISLLGAVAHNTAQLTVAAFIFQSAAVFWYLPLLIISAVVTGLFTGFCAQSLLRRSKASVL